MRTELFAEDQNQDPHGIPGTNITGETYGTKRGIHTIPVAEYRLQHAIEQIYDEYGDRVYIKPKSLSKFGQNELVGTSFATLMTLPSGVLTETYVSTNAITHISSSGTADTSTVVVEGHTISGSDLTFVTQSATLNGQNKVALTTPLARATRVYNTGTANWTGQIYVYQDDTLSGGVPVTNSKIHLITPEGALGRNQSFKAATAISSQDYWLITSLRVGLDKKASASAEVELQIRRSGSVFRTIFEMPLDSDGTNAINIALDPVIIAPKNSDVLLRARASTTSVSVSGRIAGYLALVDNS